MRDIRTDSRLTYRRQIHRHIMRCLNSALTSTQHTHDGVVYKCYAHCSYGNGQHFILVMLFISRLPLSRNAVKTNIACTREKVVVICVRNLHGHETNKKTSMQTGCLLSVAFEDCGTGTGTDAFTQGELCGVLGRCCCSRRRKFVSR